MLSFGVLFFSFIAIMVTRALQAEVSGGQKERWSPEGAQMDAPGGEARAGQGDPGKLRLERKGGYVGKGSAGAPARARGSLTWCGHGGRSPLQSADTKPGPPRGRDARPGRGARALCLRALQPARAPPRPRPRLGTPASGSAGLGVAGSLGIAVRAPARAPPLRALSALPARTRSVSGTQGRSAERGEGEAPRPPRLPSPRLAGVGFHGEVPGRLSEKRQRHQGGGLPSPLPLLSSVQPRGRLTLPTGPVLLEDK